MCIDSSLFFLAIFELAFCLITKVKHQLAQIHLDLSPRNYQQGSQAVIYNL